MAAGIGDPSRRASLQLERQDLVVLGECDIDDSCCAVVAGGALLSTGRTDEARAVYETLRGLPAADDKDSRILGALTQIMDVILAFRDTDVARATYDLFRPQLADSGATGTGVVFLTGSLHWPLGPAGSAAGPRTR